MFCWLLVASILSLGQSLPLTGAQAYWVVTLTSSNTLNNLMHRLDLVNCWAPMPNQNHMARYNAAVGTHYWTGRYVCYSSLQGSQTSLGNGPIYYLESHGYDGISTNYPSNTIQQFHVKCSQGTHLKVMHNETFINLEEKEKIGTSVNACRVCMDYIKINRLNDECELCGTEDTRDCKFIQNPIFAGPFGADLKVTFRSGPSVEKLGFHLTMVCKSANEENLHGCLELSDSLLWENYMNTENWNQNEQELLRLAETSTSVPRDAAHLLLKFHYKHQKNTLTKSVSSYKDMLALAEIAVKSCDAAVKVIGREVKNIFSKQFQESSKLEYFEDEDLIYDNK